MSTTTIALDVPMGISSDNGFEVVISRDGRIVSRTIYGDITKAKVKKVAIKSVGEFLEIHHGRGDWTATVYEAHLTSYEDLKFFTITYEWVRSNDTPFFTF